jgi:hypothetical protein
MTNLHCHFGSFLSPRRVDREKPLRVFPRLTAPPFWTHPPLTLLFFSRPRLGGFGAPSSDPSLPLRTGSAVPARSCLRSALPRCPWQPGKSRSAGTAFPPTNTTHISPRSPSSDHTRRIRVFPSSVISWEQISPRARVYLGLQLSPLRRLKKTNFKAAVAVMIHE